MRSERALECKLPTTGEESVPYRGQHQVRRSWRNSTASSFAEQHGIHSTAWHEPQEDDARPEDSASQVGAHQFLGTMSTLGVGEPGRARKRRTSCTVERFPLFAEIQARDTVTSHAASTAATARDTVTSHAASTAATAQAAGEVLTRPSTRCGCEFRCCCKFCRKARAYEAEDASKGPACEEASRENHDKAYWGCS